MKEFTEALIQFIFHGILFYLLLFVLYIWTTHKPASEHTFNQIEARFFLVLLFGEPDRVFWPKQELIDAAQRMSERKLLVSHWIADRAIERLNRKSIVAIGRLENDEIGAVYLQPPLWNKDHREELQAHGKTIPLEALPANLH